jgi:hypothetical protein
MKGGRLEKHQQAHESEIKSDLGLTALSETTQKTAPIMSSVYACLRSSVTTQRYARLMDTHVAAEAARPAQRFAEDSVKAV